MVSSADKWKTGLTCFGRYISKLHKSPSATNINSLTKKTHFIQDVQVFTVSVVIEALKRISVLVVIKVANDYNIIVIIIRYPPGGFHIFVDQGHVPEKALQQHSPETTCQ